MKKNQVKILLFGMHCSGKTTFGRLLAKYFKCAFIDIDEQIAKRHGMSVRSFYLANGRKAFQKTEYEMFAECLSFKATSKPLLNDVEIISVGGGLIENEKARLLLEEKQKGERDNIAVVFLSMPKNILFNRLLKRAKREPSFPAFLQPYINKDILEELNKNNLSFSQLKHKHLGQARNKFYNLNENRLRLLKSIKYIKLKTKRKSTKQLFKKIKEILTNSLILIK